MFGNRVNDLRSTLESALATIACEDTIQLDRTRSAFLQQQIGLGGISRVTEPTFAPGVHANGSLTSNDLILAATIKSRISSHVNAQRNQMLFEKIRALKQKQLLSRITQGQSFQQPLLSMLSLCMQQNHSLANLSLQKQEPATHAEPSKREAKKTIEVLGTSLRKKDDEYVDANKLVTVVEGDKTAKKTRGGVTEPFPEKLHRMLREVEEEGKSDIISFYAHGRAFGVHNPQRFVSEIMPKYFKQSRLSSFFRQLNLYGFQRITSGPDAGGYYHELFLEGKVPLCHHMRRVGVPKGGDRRKQRAKNVVVDIDFYSMPKL